MTSGQRLDGKSVASNTTSGHRPESAKSRGTFPSQEFSQNRREEWAHEYSPAVSLSLLLPKFITAHLYSNNLIGILGVSGWGLRGERNNMMGGRVKRMGEVIVIET